MIHYLRALTAGLLETSRNLPRNEGRFFLLGAVGYPVAAAVHFFSAILFWVLDIPVLVIWDALSAVLYATIWWLLVTRNIQQSGFILSILIETPLRAWLATAHIGFEAGFWLFPMLAVATIAMAPFFSRRAMIVLSVLMTLITLAMTVMALVVPPIVNLSTGWVLFFMTTNLATTFLVLGLLNAVFAAAVSHAETGLEREFNRAEGLLRNILPDAIALRLKDGETVIADEYEEATVIFADIVNFTQSSAKLSPAELVETLNAVFTEFDRLAAHHGTEKIKTIGDAYMAVVGVPEAQSDHATRAVELALDMLSAARRVSADTHFPIDLRIGINTGPVVAGVIGTDKFAYDLWGDAVNVASRMEVLSAPGTVLVTETTHARLADRIMTRPAGLRDVKGKGEMPVFEVVPV